MKRKASGTICLQQAVNFLHAFHFICELISEVLQSVWLQNTLLNVPKFQKETLERDLRRPLKEFLLEAYVLFMSGDSGSRKWLFISLILPHLKMSSFVWILWRFRAVIEGCGEALWSRRSHDALLHKQTRGVSRPRVLLTAAVFMRFRHLKFFLTPFLSFSGDMLDLLKWRAHPERINDSLSKLKEIDGSEIVKVGPQRNTNNIDQ